MEKIFLNFSLQSFIIFFLTINSYAQFSGGIGSVDNPFIISTLEDLRTLSEDASYWGGNFQLSQNIDASDTKNWNAGEGFYPIGEDFYSKFTGSFNGLGYYIFNLYINNSSLDNVGFFGYVDGAQIHHLGLVNIDIIGSKANAQAYSIGGLAAVALNSTISHCYVQGSVFSTQADSRLGGFISNLGVNSNIEESYAYISVKADFSGGLVCLSGGTISDCWVGGSVDGITSAGGLTSIQSTGIIKRCYAVAKVSCPVLVGGFCGMYLVAGGVEEDCFYDATLSQQTNAFGDGNNRDVISLNTADFGDSDHFFDANWNINDTWRMLALPTVDTQIRPYLKMQLANNYIKVKANPVPAAILRGTGYYELGDMVTVSFTAIPLHTFKGWKRNGVIESTDSTYSFSCTGNETIEAFFEVEADFSGSGTVADPYQIATINDLQDIASFPSLYDKNYILTSDIDASTTSTWNGGKGFLPIGNVTYPFTGNFNGKYHIISGLYINRTSEDATGLFNYTQSANIIYMGLEDCKIYGGDNTGAIIGKDIGNSSIENVFIEGLVTGKDTIGGFIGSGINSKLDISYSLAQIYGQNNVGGLVGFISGDFSIYDVYAAAPIYSEGSVGGVVCDFSSNTNSSPRGFYDISTTKLGFNKGTKNGDSSTSDWPTNYFSYDIIINSYFDMVNKWQLAYGRDNIKRPILKWEESFSLSFSNDGNGSTSIEEEKVILGINLPSVYAYPDSVHTFSHWLNEDTGEKWTTNPLNITELDRDYNITAVFTQNTGTHQVTFNKLYLGTPYCTSGLLKMNNNYFEFDLNNQVILTNVPDGTYAYTVIGSSNFSDIEGFFTVSGNDIIEDVELVTEKGTSISYFNYDFWVFDDENSAPIANVDIVLKTGESIKTDIKGEASVNAKYGTSYFINEPNYAEVNGELLSEYLIQISLETSYSIELEISDSTQILINATVLLDGKTYVTDNQGKVQIPKVTSGSYNMLISASGYTSINHTVNVVNGNVSEILILAPATAPTHTINFKVDNGFEIVPNAMIIISLQNTPLGLTTNENGEVSVILEEGTYPLIVSASFFSKLEQSLVVSGIDEQIDITLTSTEYLTYKVIDLDYNVVPDATLTAENGTVFSFDSNGSLRIQGLGLGATYHFTVSAPDFKSRSVTKTVDGMFIHTELLLAQATDLEVTCTDGVSPLPDIEFNIKGEDYVSDSQGEILISGLSYKSTLSFMAEKEGYYPIAGNIILDNLNGNVKNLIFTQDQDPISNYEIKFNVEDEVNNSIAGATVYINGIKYSTETNGLVTIGKLPDGSYPYTVSADGFTFYRGTLVISGDDVIEVVQLETSSGSTADYIISGYIYLENTSTPLSGVSLIGFYAGIVTTDVNGYYETLVPFGWGDTVRAILSGYDFKPDSIIYNNVNTNLINNNYEGFLNQVYTVTFKDQDGTELKTETVEYEKSATAPTDPTRTGYTFTGWDVDFSKISSDLIVTAQYSINSYTVIFKDYDGTELLTESVEYEKSVTPPSDPTRTGYTFTGWDVDFSKVTSDLTVTAQYSINTYTVIFKDYEGTELLTESVEYEQSATAPSNPIRTGFTFSGWDVDFSKITSDLTVTAEYSINSYTVTFKDYDGTELLTESVEYEKSAIAPSDPTRTGFTFTGWDVDFSKVTSDLIITAQYSQNGVSNYTVIFNNWDGITISTQTVAENNSATAPTDPIRTGYTFTGWDIDFSVITSDTTITAQYSINSFVVTFNDHDGTVLKTETVEYEKSATAPTDPIRSGYTFTGWDVDFSKITSDLAVTAQYTIESYILYFKVYGNGILSGDTVQTVNYAESASQITAIAGEGSYFTAWQTANGTIISYDNPFTLTNVISDTTLFVVFEWNTYQVSFSAEANGMVTGNTEQTIEYNKSTSEVAANANEGYFFNKWENADGSTYSTNSTLVVDSVHENISFTAIFSETEPSSINIQKTLDLDIYPNPTTGILNIELPNALEEADLTIYSIAGELLYSNPSFNGGVVNVSELNQGLYIVKVNSHDRVSISKILKQ